MRQLFGFQGIGSKMKQDSVLKYVALSN